MAVAAVIIAIVVIGNVFPGKIFMQDQASRHYLLFEIQGLLCVLYKNSYHAHLNIKII